MDNGLKAELDKMDHLMGNEYFIDEDLPPWKLVIGSDSLLHYVLQGLRHLHRYGKLDDDDIVEYYYKRNKASSDWFQLVIDCIDSSLRYIPETYRDGIAEGRKDLVIETRAIIAFTGKPNRYLVEKAETLMKEVQACALST